MSTPSTSTPSNLLVTQDFVGVEIEVQGSVRNNQPEGWSIVPEGSVQGFELVTSGPKAGNSLVDCLFDVEEYLQPYQSHNPFPEMTSVHVHVNTLDLTVPQLISFIILSVMFEPVLYNYVHHGRRKNHFCLPMTDSESTLDQIGKMINRFRRQGNLSRNDIRSLFNPERCKYSGINLSSLGLYGTLEFRMHHGTSNVDELLRWINILLSIKAYARDRDPVNILETKQEVGISSIFDEVFGVYRGLLDYQGAEEDILHGIRNAQDLVSEFNLPVGHDVLSFIPDSDSSLYTQVVNRFGWLDDAEEDDEEYEDEDDD